MGRERAQSESTLVGRKMNFLYGSLATNLQFIRLISTINWLYVTNTANTRQLNLNITACGLGHLF